MEPTRVAATTDKYIGMAVFASQMSLDENVWRNFMLDNESMETGELWWKLHEHNYHCSKQDVSRFKTLRKKCAVHSFIMYISLELDNFIF